MVAKFTQPNYTDPAQSGTGYPLAIDAAVAVLAEQAAQFAVNAQDTPNLTVAMRAGRLAQANGTTLAIAAQNSGALTAPTVNPRNDIVYYDAASGAIGVAAGTEAASPADPAIPANKVPVARIRWTVGMASITNSVVDDLRVRNPLPPLLGRFQVFNVNGNFTAPHAGNYLIIAIGGGGGGGGGGFVPTGTTGSSSGGTGGAGGRLAISQVALTAGQVVAVTIGAGGVGGTSENAGAVGGNTTFGALVTAVGGVWGRPGLLVDSATSRGQSGGTGGGYGGGESGTSNTLASSNGNGGGGAGGPGGGGAGGTGATNDGTAVNRAGGTGGNGNAGICIVIW